MPTRSIDNSNSRLLISEILRKVSNAKTKKEKVDLLRKHNTPALRQLLIINFDDSIVSMMPEGDVPYTPNDAHDASVFSYALFLLLYVLHVPLLETFANHATVRADLHKS